MTNTSVKLNTCYGPVFMAPATHAVASGIFCGDPKALINQLEGDVQDVKDGKDLEKLREECCAGTDPGSEEESAWSDWVDTVDEISKRPRAA